jgi:hypothetical protein
MASDKKQTPNLIIDDVAAELKCFDNFAITESCVDEPIDNQFLHQFYEHKPLIAEQFVLTKTNSEFIVVESNNNNNNNSQEQTPDEDVKCTEFLTQLREQEHQEPVSEMESTQINDPDFTQSQKTQPNIADSLLSPAEVPLGRRYAEIALFKSHPNVEW